MITVLALTCATLCQAGGLVLQNDSKKILFCQLDQKQISVLPHFRKKISQPIHSVTCNGLTLKNIFITSNSSDHWFIYNGKAKKVLNVLLYPFIPTFPFHNFSSLQKRIIQEFQMLHPEILLNLTLDDNERFNSYVFNNLKKILGPNGFDIVEIDSMLLGEIVRRGYVSPIKINPNIFWPISYSAASIHHQQYGVPSRICAYYLFSLHPTLEKDFLTLPSLLKFLHTLPPDRIGILADYNGGWNAISFYLQALLSNNHMNSDFNSDKSSLDSLRLLTHACFFKKKNNCINNFYHAQPIQRIEKDFAQGKSFYFLGFSESAFFTKLYAKSALHATLISYGKYFHPLIYTDVYVKNASTCNEKKCGIYFKYFTDYMNTASTQEWINFSEDLEKNMPARYLLPAIKAFYALPRVSADHLYVEFMKKLNQGAAYPNSISEKEFFNLYFEIKESVFDKQNLLNREER